MEVFGINPLLLARKEELTKEELAEAIRIAIIAELDAINFYEQLARSVTLKDDKIKKVFLDIAREEKTHFGEFLTLLEMLDKEQVSELKKGREEVEELMGK